jgi:hypothetical protein
MSRKIFLEIKINEEENIKVWNPKDLDGDFVKIGVISGFLRQQDQYLSRYFHGEFDDWPNLCDGLRVKNEHKWNYHSWEMHRDDVKTFVERLRGYYMKRTKHN